MLRKHSSLWIAALGFGLLFSVYAEKPAFAASEVHRVNDSGQEEIWYLLDNGDFAGEHWLKKDDNWYYLSRTGNPMKNTVVLAMDDKYYALDEMGRMLRSGTMFFGGLPWVVSSDGTAAVEMSEDEAAIEEFAAVRAAAVTAGCSTAEEKASAVYEDVWQLQFTDSNETDGDMQAAAIKAFDQNRGNCFGQMAKMHYLLQAAGIRDMTVEACENGRKLGHWWNLAKIGDRYYHMDATPFAGHGAKMLTTEELKMQSMPDEMIAYLHQYDEENYPESAAGTK